MPVEHLSRDATPDAIAEVLKRDACVVIDRLAPSGLLDKIKAEMAPYVAANQDGVDDFTGFQTRRTGALIARSPASHELVTHPLVTGAVKKLLAHATSFHVHLTQIIAIGPGETPQPIHRDQWAFDMLPFPKGYEVQCNTLWAMTDFTEQNGATRVIPGSHKLDDRLKFAYEETEAAEMDKGSVLMYTGALYHGGGTNKSDAIRAGLNLTYAVSWLRQEENQYLTVPHEIARDLPVPLLRLMGYARGAYALGYIDDMRDPIAALRPELGKLGLGDGERSAEQMECIESLLD